MGTQTFTTTRTLTLHYTRQRKWSRQRRYCRQITEEILQTDKRGDTANTQQRRYCKHTIEGYCRHTTDNRGDTAETQQRDTVDTEQWRYSRQRRHWRLQIIEILQ